MALFKKGVASNPNGRPAGARNRFSAKLLEDLIASWNENGQAALRIMCRERPSDYVRAMISVLPREFVLEGVMTDFDDGQIDEILEGLKRRIAQIRQDEAAMQLPVPSSMAN